MRNVILCICFFVVGAIASWAGVGYWTRSIHQRQLATMYAGEIGVAAMRAQQMKLGEADLVLKSLENGFPDQVLFIRDNEMFKDNFVADTALMSVKRFYVCTKTDIPERIAPILADVPLAADACSQ